MCIRDRQAIGCLTYASIITRPDISVAVNTLSKFMTKPSMQHWLGIKRILRYIRGTTNYGLYFSHLNASDNELIGYSDADCGGDTEDRRSTSAFMFQIGNSLVSWCSCKQATVAKSTTEAEYVALSCASQETI